MELCESKPKYDMAKIYREFAPAIYRLCWQTAHNRQTALDLRQDIFLKILKGLPRFRGEAKLSSWIFQITKFHCADHLRQRQRSAWLVAEDQVKYEHEPRVEAEDDRIHQQLDLLPMMEPCLPTTKLILQLHFMEGYSQEEVAGVLGYSRAAVCRRIRSFSRKVSQGHLY